MRVYVRFDAVCAVDIDDDTPEDDIETEAAKKLEHMLSHLAVTVNATDEFEVQE